MIHRAWSSIVEVPYCFSRSYVKFQGHTALKIFEFDPNWAFPDCNSSLNSPMAMKCCTKLETAKERCPIVFQGHPSNFKVTRYKTSPILTQIERFRTIGRSQLSNPSDLPCLSNNLLLHSVNQNINWSQLSYFLGMNIKRCNVMHLHNLVLKQWFLTITSASLLVVSGCLLWVYGENLPCDNRNKLHKHYPGYYFVAVYFLISLFMEYRSYEGIRCNTVPELFLSLLQAVRQSPSYFISCIGMACLNG